MIHEIRAYQVDQADVAEFERLFGDAYVDREVFSPLTGFWHTVDQSVSEVIHIWPYEDLAQRTELRSAAAQHPNWPPPTSRFINRMVAEVVLPFEFAQDREPGVVGSVVEIQYDYFAVADLRAAGEAWAPAIEERSKHDALVLAGRLEFGQANGIVQVWAYPDEERRAQSAAEAADRGVWPPLDGPMPTSTVTKVMAPSTFSPLQ